MFRRHIRLLTLLSLVGTCVSLAVAVTGGRAYAHRTSVTQAGAGKGLTVPAEDTGIPSCAHANLDLRACLSALIERKVNPTPPLTIQIAPGTYRIGAPGGLLIFQRQNITIRGSRRPGTPSSSASDTRIEIDPTFRDHEPTRILATFAQIIDSGNISFEDLDLDGGNARVQGFDVCPLDDDPNHVVKGIRIHNIRARNFTDFFTLIGQSIVHAYLLGDAHAPDPALARLYRFTGSTDMLGDPHQECGGTFRDIEFTDNVLLLKSVGFYVTPLLVWQTKQYSELSGPDFVRTDGGKETKVDWYDVMMESVTKNADIIVRGNQFIADIDPSFPNYRKQLDGYFHSGMKVQGVAGLVVQKNRFDASENSDVWGTGAAINIASFTLKPLIDGNVINFPSAHKFKNHGIIVEGGFIPHIWYGLGLVRYTRHQGSRVPVLTQEASNLPPAQKAGLGFGGVGIFGPSLGVRITNNVLHNAWITVDACCGNTIEQGPKVMMWTDTAALCEDMDAHQKPGDRKNDNLLIMHNSFEFAGAKPSTVVGGLPTATPPEHELKANSEFSAHHPGAPFRIARQCRRSMSYTIEGNTITP